MSDEIASIGIKVDTIGVVEGTKALDGLAAQGPRVEASLGKLEQTSGRTGKSLATLGQGGGQGLQKVGRDAEQAAAGIKRMETATVSASSELANLGKSVFAFVSAREIVRAADAVTTLQNQLKLATGSAQAAASAYGSLFEIAQRSRVNFTELGGTFSSITRASESLKLSQQQILGLTETIANAITVSGSSASASQAALIQLGQGLASGVLRGEELNSILEQTPRLARALADGLGVPIGALRKLGEEGKLSAEAVIQALSSQGATLAREVQASTATVAQSFVQLQNAATVMTGEIDRSTGVSKLLTVSASAAAASLGDITEAFKGLDTAGTDFALVGDAISLTMETIAVLGANLAFTIKGVSGEFVTIGKQAYAVASGDFGRAAALSEEWRAQSERARKEVDAFSERLIRAGEVRRQLAREMAGLDTRAEDAKLARQAGNATAPLDFSALVTGATKAKKAVKDLGDQFADQRAAAKEWADSFLDFTRIQREAEASSLGLSKGQARLLEYLRSPGYANASEAMREINLQQAYAAISAEQFADAQKSAAKAAEEAAEAHAQYLIELNRGGEEVAKQVQKLREEEEALTISAAKNVSLAQAIELVAVARLQEQQAAFSGAGNQAGVDAIQREIDKRKELMGLLGNKEARDAAKRALDDTTREAERMARSIEQSLTDSLMRGFESGKGFAETLKGSVEAMFKTLVLRPTIEAASKQLAGGQGGSITAWLPMLDAAVSASAGKWGEAAGTAFGTYVGGPLGAVIGKTLGSVADKVFSGGAGTPHMGAMYISNGAYGYVPGERVVGDMAYGDSVYKNRSSQVEDYLKGVTTGTAAALNSISKNFGGLGGFQVGGYFAADNRDPSQGNIRILQGGADVATVSARYSANGEAGLKEYTTQLSSEVRKAIYDIGLPDWAKGMLDKIGEAPALDQLAATVDQINATQKALGDLDASFTPLGGVFARIAALSGDSTLQLAGFLGGLEGLDQLTRSYYDSFYSEAEKSAASTQRLTAALGSLGYGLPATREAFRALVDAQDLTTEAGRKNAAELLKLSPIFASITAETKALGDTAGQTAKDIAEAAARAAEAGARALAGLSDDRGGLEVQLLRARGDEAGAVARELQISLAKLTEGLNATDAAAAIAAQAYNDALQQQIDAANKARDVASERFGIEGQILQLMGDTAALRQRELDALDPSNRALQERYYRLQDEQAAKVLADQAIAKAADEAAAKVRALADVLGGLGSTRFDLENQLLSMQGNDAEVLRRTRERDLAELTKGLSATDAARVTAAYDYNAALKRQIADTQAATQAAQAMAQAQASAAQAQQQAAEQIRSAWQTAANSIYDEVARIRGLISGGSAQSYASAQSAFAIAAAQARAGDQEAAKLLPGLSQAMLTLAEAQATSLVELQRIRAQTAATLSGVGGSLASQYGLIPRLDTGTNYVPRDTLALIHEGEAVVPRAYNPAAGGQGAGNAELVAEMQALRAELIELRKQVDKSNDNTGRTATAIEGRQTVPFLVEIAQ